MGHFNRAMNNRKGDIFMFIMILVFFILSFSVILIEYFRIESLYQQVEYVIQRGVNSSVEYAMRDDYRRDGCSRLDSVLAKEIMYAYFYEDMELDAELNKYAGDQWIYQLEVERIDVTDSPPCLTLAGTLKTRSVFNLLKGTIRLPFTISSTNIRIEEGGSYD